MKQVTIPAPPSYMSGIGSYNAQQQFNNAVVQWMQQLKGILEQAMQVNTLPMQNPIVVGSFTTNTQISGTSTGTDLANFVATLAQAMTDYGLASPTVKR